MSEGNSYFEWAPSEWPPSTRVELQTSKDGTDEIRVQCEPGGYFRVQVMGTGGTREHLFQRVSMRTGEYAKLAVTWNGHDVRFFAGGEKLGPYVAGEAPLEVLSFSAHAPSGRSVPIAGEVLAIASSEEWLFLMTLHDLSERIARGTAYDIIRASGLLRQLLFDVGAPLAHAANRGTRLRLEFTIATTSPLPAKIEKPGIEWRSLYPANDQEPSERLNLDRFLALVTITSEGVGCTVRDVVAAVAHVFGGVHLGRPEEEEDKALVALRDRVLVQRQSLVLRAVQDIGQVCIEGLLPLATAIARMRSG
jgi:hypothetical protein